MARPLLIVPLFLAIYGYGTIDRDDFFVLSAAPFTLHPDATRQYVQSSPLAYVIGYPFTVTLGPFPSYAVVMLGGVAFFLFALNRFVGIRYGTGRNHAMLMFLATPLLIVVTQYIGKGDPYLMTFFLLLASTSSAMAQIVCACLVVLGHREIGMAVLVSAVCLRVAPARSTALGAAIGLSLMYGYHHYLLAAVPQSRAMVGMVLLTESLDYLMTTPMLHLFSLFGPFWLCVAMAGPLGVRWWSTLLATMVVAAATLDITRVFVQIGLPLMIGVVDRLVVNDDGATVAPPPRWFHLLPFCAFFQLHLVSYAVYHSRVPKLVMRLIEALKAGGR